MMTIALSHSTAPYPLNRLNDNVLDGMVRLLDVTGGNSC